MSSCKTAHPSIVAYTTFMTERFVRLWRFYLASCEAGFLERHCTVNQFVFAGRRWRPEGLELRPT